MKLITPSFLCLVLIATSCAPASTGIRTVPGGEVVQGPGGGILSAKIQAQCTEGKPKSYTDNVEQTIEAALKLDQLSKEDTIRVLSEFSRNLNVHYATTSEGADLESIMFYICQISLNRGFSEKTTESLMEKAIDAYKSGKRSEKSPDELKLVDLWISDSYSNTTLDVMVRNTGDQVAYIKRAELILEKVWEVPRHVRTAELINPSAEYHAQIPTATLMVPATLAVKLSHSVGPASVDRIMFHMSIEKNQDTFKANLYLGRVKLIYDEDNKELISPSAFIVGECECGPRIFPHRSLLLPRFNSDKPANSKVIEEEPASTYRSIIKEVNRRPTIMSTKGSLLISDFQEYLGLAAK